MKIYLVGGAVRDQLLGLPIQEKDWVVVGATETEMLDKGFKQVGKDFPVFLHPKTGEEYALARLERKIGAGYKGFSFDTSKQVTLEEDLKRRDLTINAIAQTQEGVIIDPYQGQKDLKAKVLRHVSSAFSEDPVRVLRVARFQARYQQLGFKIAPETLCLMKQMVLDGEVNALTPERVFKELERALKEKNPEVFFEVLKECGALSILFSEMNMFDQGIPALKRAAALTEDPQIRLATLLHNQTPENLKKLFKKMAIPNEYANLTQFIAKHLNEYNKLSVEQSSHIVEFLESADAFRREERFNKILISYQACTQSSKNKMLLLALEAGKKIKAEDYLSTFKGKSLGEKIHLERIQAVSKELQSFKK